jgi:hypothetical protein
MRALLRAACCCLAILTAGCSARAPIAFFDNPMPLLIWYGDQVRPAGTRYPGMPDQPEFGSISGLAPDAATNQWIAAIDDREHTRVAWLQVSYSGKNLEVAPTKMVELRAGSGVDPRVVTHADLEAIVALPSGGFVLSEEGHISGDAKEIWQPVLMQMNADGVVTAVIDFPKEFQITGDGKTGVRDNQGFEGLAVTPAGRLIAGMEQPLIQDGLTTFDRIRARRIDLQTGAPVALHDLADATHRGLRHHLQRR